MSLKPPLSLEILRQACLVTGDRFEITDQESAFMARVTRRQRSFLANAGFSTVYPLNTHAAAELAGDKAYTADVLRNAAIRVLGGQSFFTDATDAARYGTGRSPADALRFAEKLGYPVFAKLNGGAHGRLARRIADADALITYLREAREVEHLILIQPIIEQPEARVFVLNGRARFLYRRERLALVGDGQRTVGEIAGEYLRDPRIAQEPTGLHGAAQTLAKLARGRRALGDVPRAGEVVVAADAANLALGGQMLELNLAPSDAVHAWAAKVAAASHLSIFGADVFYERLDDPATWQVIELNANPSLSGLWRDGQRDAAIAIWRDVMDLYFEK